jgi:cyanophycinase
MPSRPTAALATRGWLVPIGGRMEDPAILRRFIDLCGGDASRIVVIPTASNMHDTAEFYAAIFRRAGCLGMECVSVASRADAASRDVLESVESAAGVFFTGGNQLKLATVIGGTPLARLLRARHAAGMHVAGTSAGASFVSATMIAFGEEGKLPRAGMVTTCAGLGLTDRFIIDQHFRERDRLGRLVTAVAYNPLTIGLGVDENTAAFISPDECMHVVGQGAVTVVDPATLDASHLLETEMGMPLHVPGMAVHVVGPGERYEFADVPESVAA